MTDGTAARALDDIERCRINENQLAQDGRIQALEEKVCELDGFVRRLRARDICRGCGWDGQRCHAIIAPAIKCCPDCSHV